MTELHFNMTNDNGRFANFDKLLGVMLNKNLTMTCRYLVASIKKKKAPQLHEMYQHAS